MGLMIEKKKWSSILFLLTWKELIGRSALNRVGAAGQSSLLCSLVHLSKIWIVHLHSAAYKFIHRKFLKWKVLRRVRGLLCFENEIHQRCRDSSPNFCYFRYCFKSSQLMVAIFSFESVVRSDVKYFCLSLHFLKIC